MKIISGGQSGVDRAALDAALALGFEYGGWCPRGGVAEDYPDPPGLLADYPALTETPSSDYLERTEWNVRDSTATLIIAPNQSFINSGGTGYTLNCIHECGQDHFVALLDEPGCRAEAENWFRCLNDAAILNVAGPRESKAQGVYQHVLRFMHTLLGTRARRGVPSPAS